MSDPLGLPCRFLYTLNRQASVILPLVRRPFTLCMSLGYNMPSAIDPLQVARGQTVMKTHSGVVWRLFYRATVYSIAPCPSVCLSVIRRRLVTQIMPRCSPYRDFHSSFQKPKTSVKRDRQTCVVEKLRLPINNSVCISKKVKDRRSF